MILVRANILGQNKVICQTTMDPQHGGPRMCHLFLAAARHDILITNRRHTLLQNVMLRPNPLLPHHSDQIGFADLML